MTVFGYTIQAEYVICTIVSVFLILFILLIIQTIRINKLNKRLRNFMEGKDGKSLEDEIKTRFKSLIEIKKAQEDMRSEIESIIETLSKTYRKSYVQKYDAFSEMGGKLSTVIVMLDGLNDGYIINSVHSTNVGSYMYVKKVEDGEADVELSKEEENALARAMLR